MMVARGHGPKVAAPAALLLLLIGGCGPKEKFPVEPRIAFERFEQFNDSASLTISFTDGDGDIGLSETDLQPPFDSGSYHYHNLFLTYEYMQNGEWVQPQLDLALHYRIPRITPTGQNKVLKGEISVALKPWPAPGNPFDTSRFEIKLVDRALHESNSVSTGMLVDP
jgi:hypothetical protein